MDSLRNGEVHQKEKKKRKERKKKEGKKEKRQRLGLYRRLMDPTLGHDNILQKSFGPIPPHLKTSLLLLLTAHPACLALARLSTELLSLWDSLQPSTNASSSSGYFFFLSKFPDLCMSVCLSVTHSDSQKTGSNTYRGSVSLIRTSPEVVNLPHK